MKPTDHHNVALRPATDAHDEFLYAVYAGTRADEIAIFGWDEAQQNAFLRMQFTARQQAYGMQFPAAAQSIIFTGELPVGHLIVDRSDGQILLVDIALLPECRGSGIGADLVRQLQDEAAAAGVSVVLRVDRTNTGAIRFYERLDFTVTDQTQLLFEMKWTG